MLCMRARGWEKAVRGTRLPCSPVFTDSLLPRPASSGALCRADAHVPSILSGVMQECRGAALKGGGGGPLSMRRRRDSRYAG